MADLKPLIRYRKHQLDEKRKNLARLYDQLDSILETKNKLLGDMEKERAHVNENPEDIYALESLNRFYGATKKKIEAINLEIEKMEKRIELVREDLRITFGDLKKIEITQERRVEEQRKELAEKEIKLFNEIGQQIHQRQNA